MKRDEMRQDRFSKLFGKKPVIGMIHLSGAKPVDRALKEMDIYQEEGLDGAIVENYHGSVSDVKGALVEISKRDYSVAIGVNILPNEFQISFPLARDYGAKFIQLDHVAGKYTRGQVDIRSYWLFRNRYNDIAVLGGVHPKYYTPLSDMEKDLAEGKSRADAVVVTGSGTGVETPVAKIKKFKSILGDDYPLVIGAGLTAENACEQLAHADGVIVGSYFKNGNTEGEVEAALVRRLMKEVFQTRLELA